MISKELIENRINNFWGYGNLDSDFWFIGMEEGFDGTISELKSRFELTNDKEVIDIQSGMDNIDDHLKWFIKNPPLQRTWSKLIRMLLIFKGESVSNDKIRTYQANKLARTSSNHCLLEFMPLPSKSLNEKHWLYTKFDIDYLVDRKSYLDKVTELRIKLFKNLVEKYNPTIVVFYSLIYLDKWNVILGEELQSILPGKLLHYEGSKTHFFVTPHPTARGFTNQDFDNISAEILKRSNYGKTL